MSGRIRGQKLLELLRPWTGGSSGKVAPRLSSSLLHAALRQVVLDGRLPPGTRLPAERELAEVFGVSRTLISRTLDRLREEGFVASQRGAGSWVTLPSGKSGSEITGRAGWTPPAESEGINLSHATPAAPPELGPAIDRARVRFAEQVTSHGYHPHGLDALRERIAQRFTDRGLPTVPDQVLITNGAQHALALVLRLLVSPGERVLVEHPSYPNALEAIRSVKASLVPVPVDENGWDLEAVEAVLRQACPSLAYLVPDFHNPTGVRLDGASRERLAAMLRRHRTTAVVDETLVDLDLSGEDPVPPMAAFGDHRIITVGSASKTFWGGLRLGWIRASEELVQRLVVRRPMTDFGSPVFEQLALFELLEDPEPALGRRRAETAARRDELARLLRQHCPQWRFRVPDGGLALWCDLGALVSSRLAVVAEQHGVRVVPGSRFAAQGALERRLRLPYTLPAEQLEEAVRRLARAAVAVSGATLGSWDDPVA